MNNKKQTAGETAPKGFYWKHDYTLNCDALSAANLGHLIRLLDDFLMDKVDPTELELADPEVQTAFHFITNDIKEGRAEE